MQNLVRRKPFTVTKMQQLFRAVRDSHAVPMTGSSRPPDRVAAAELGVTFIGHSSFLLQIGGKNLLVDPVFSKRLILLRRMRRPGVVAEQMPAIDAVLVTHAHMDHLDLASLRQIVRRTRRLSGREPEIVVPSGVEDLVERLGFARIHEMQWWEQLRLAGGLEVTMTPCSHWGARRFRDTYRGYGGYVIEGGGHSVYHSGDSAYFDGFRAIGQRLRPRVALLPIGAYFPDSYRAVHTNPEEALQAFRDCCAERMVPMHYGTFRLGREPVEEPVARLLAEAGRLGIRNQVYVLGEGDTMRMDGRSA
ncbi:MAG: MBL fold metallo-hydrolase [Acidobacteriaceae bacterium]|nr:MBL fold metallo-hydrolase [Acidobacteriaceae bacterium]